MYQIFRERTWNLEDKFNIHSKSRGLLAQWQRHRISQEQNIRYTDE
jgi:hypothetical protein